MHIKLGTRPSKLALRQIDEIRDKLSGIGFEVVTIETAGDKDKVTPLVYRENSDFFTGEIEKALIGGKIDAAVHSAKDLEELTPKELTLAAVTKSISPYDAVVSKRGVRLNDLPMGAVIGTSSVKRKEGLLRFRYDFTIKDLRGNVDERLRQLYDGKFDAIIVAHAALIRLGIKEGYEVLPASIIEPHPLQGRLAIQVRRSRRDLIKLFGEIDER